MVTEQAWWQAAAAAETVVTVSCAGFSAAYFLHAWRQAASPGRRTAAFTLVLTTLGAAAQAAASLAWQADPSLVVTAGLPACAGQALVAVLVLRQLGDK